MDHPNGSSDEHMLSRVIDHLGVLRDTIEAYNAWIPEGLQRQINASPITYTDKTHGLVNLTFEIDGVDPPYYTLGAKESRHSRVYPMFSQEAMLRKAAWMSKVRGHPVLRKKKSADIIERGESRDMFSILVMKGSKLDPSVSITDPQERVAIGENPHDPGAYFLYNGTIAFISNVEKLRINQVQVMGPSAHFAYHHARQTVAVPSGTAVIKVCYVPKWGICGLTTTKMGSPSSESAKGNKTEYFVKEFNYLNVFHLGQMLAHFTEKSDDPDKESFRTNPTNYMVSFMLSLLQNESQIDSFENKLAPTLHQSYQTSVYSSVMRLQKWLYCAGKSAPEVADTVISFIVDHIFPSSKTMVDKVHMLCIMTCRLLCYMLGFKGHEATSMNDWSYKRLDSSCVSFSQIFRKAYRSMTEKVMKNDSMARQGGTKGLPVMKTMVDLVNTSWKGVTDNLLAPFNDTQKKRPGAGKGFEIAESINHTNLSDFISLLTKIKVNVDKGVKSRAVRAVQESQFGQVCSTHTPDTDQCGLIKHKAITSRTTQGESADVLYINIMNTGIVKRGRDSFNATPVTLDDRFIGWCNGEDAYEKLASIRSGSPAKCICRRVGENIYIEGEVPEAVEDMLLERGYSDDEGRYKVYINDSLSINTDSDFVAEINKWSSLLNTIGKHVCIALRKSGYLEIYCDSGRSVRPVYVTDGRRILVDKYNLRGEDVSFLITNGLIDFMDPCEETSDLVIVKPSSKDFEATWQEISQDEERVAQAKARIEEARLRGTEMTDDERDIYIKLNRATVVSLEAKLDNRRRQKIRYVGLHGVTKYGIASAMSPYTNFNPSCRNTFQAKIHTQALTNLMQAYEHRAGIYSLYPTYPLVGSKHLMDVYGFKDQPQGVQALAIIHPLDLNQEDALIVSDRFASNFMSLTRFRKTAEIERSGAGGDEVVNPTLRKRIPDGGVYRFLMDNGLPMIGAKVKTGDCVLGIVRNTKDGVRNMSIYMDIGEQGTVTDIVIRPMEKVGSYGTNTVVYSIIVDRVMPFQAGDKLSTAHGQKATIGMVVPVADMPFTLQGVAVDAIMNPHSMPTRATVSTPIEMLLGRAAAMEGKMYTGTSFDEPPIDRARRILVENGAVASTSKERFVDGLTGEMFDTEVFTGSFYLQELLHKAIDKGQGRARGSYDPVSRHGKKGRKGGASIRFGEQERDAVIGHGAAFFGLERLRILSDNYTMYVCSNCYNVAPQIGPLCRYCGAENSIVSLETTYTYNLISSYVSGLGIRMYTPVKRLSQYFSDTMSDILEQEKLGEIEEGTTSSSGENEPLDIDEDLYSGEAEYIDDDDYYE